MHQCDHCNNEFNDEKHLMSHIRCDHPNIQEVTNSAKPGPSWEDDQCGKHSNRNSCIENNRPYECDVCNQRFHKRYGLIYHYKNAHRRLMYQCEHCIYGTNDEEDMKSHIRDHSNNQGESIIIDPEPSLENDQGVKHSKTNSCIENMLHEYDVCNQMFREINEVTTNHLMKDHKYLMHQSEYCNYQTNNEITAKILYIIGKRNGFMCSQ
ncbi:zinc finger protein 271-like [Harpegnathos saltator]|uniref:zinc finger protein 271-like n=1 Tax=Harpegnathos saltator TaxID=610380 RepID=UPI000DBED9BD|nr:zinc finger protein 271-like [Harpegnathos saltator]